jgi:transposase InsO family protein
MEVARSGFYAWRNRDESQRVRKDRALAVQVRASHAASGGTYGSPRVLKDVRVNDDTVGRKRIARIMKQEGLDGRRRRNFKKTTDSHHSLEIAPNLLQRNFEAEAVNEVWVADITAIRSWEGWLYLAVLIDLFSRRVVGWAMASHMRTELPLEAWAMAVFQRQPEPGIIHHSDRGVQYASGPYRDALKAGGAIASMSRKGDCWDNAVAESFFATLKKDLIYRRSWPSRAEASAAINTYIASFYNLKRRHSALGNTSPIVYEQVAHQLGIGLVA